MNITKKIHFTFSSPIKLHPLFRENIQKIKNDHKDWDVYVYDLKDMSNFIYKHYGDNVLKYFNKLNPSYGPAISDFFRYLLLFKIGGVYLDVKSALTLNLNDIIFSNDKFLISFWGQSHPGWGNNPRLKGKRCYQQWFIICEPLHPFLSLTISNVMENIDHYKVKTHGIGKDGVLNVTGPVPYTNSILRLKDFHDHRLFDSETSGLKYSILENSNKIKHQEYFNNHYSSCKLPIVFN